MAKQYKIFRLFAISALTGLLGVLQVGAQSIHPGLSAALDRGAASLWPGLHNHFDIHGKRQIETVVFNAGINAIDQSVGGVRPDTYSQASPFRDVSHITKTTSDSGGSGVRTVSISTASQEMNDLLYGFQDRDISKTLWSSDSTLYKLDAYGACSLNRQGPATRSCN